MSQNLAALLYLISGILFILALRGLSSPASSRQGNRFGIAGMALAILTTLTLSPPHGFFSWVLVILGFAIGGSVGAWRARTIAMTAMPQLIAMFHSLVGLAAVLVAAGALYAPVAFGISEGAYIHPVSTIEMSLGLAIGAITFTGSIIAFLKLDGRMSGKPIMLPARHLINIALAVASSVRCLRNSCRVNSMICASSCGMPSERFSRIAVMVDSGTLSRRAPPVCAPQT